MNKIKTLEDDKINLETIKIKITEIYRKLLSKNTAQHKLELYQK